MTHLGLDLTQKQVLSQQMVQSMEILQMSVQELESYIENLAIENPVIDLPDKIISTSDPHAEDMQRKLDWLESTDLQNKVYYQQDRDDDNLGSNLHDLRESEETLPDYLLSQLLLADYNPVQREIIEFMIRSLDHRGYFVEDPAILGEYFSVSTDYILDLLKDIQNLDPAGVGARDLKECLLLQLHRAGNYSPLTEILVKNYLEEISKNHLSVIAKKLSVSVNEVLASCKEIQSLNPKPGSSFSNRKLLQYISPDVVVVQLDNAFEILINEYQYPSININTYYQNLYKSTNDIETKNYLKEKLSQAEWVQKCISQRTATLSRVMHELIKIQQKFFLYGPGHKAPMKLTDISEQLGLHESTISRTLRNKYLQCRWGVFPLSYFLTAVATINTESKEEKTPDQLKAQIRKIIDAEDKKKPLSDQKISEKLKELNISLSRRTVNKYRTEMGIPDISGRKNYS